MNIGDDIMNHLDTNHVLMKCFNVRMGSRYTDSCKLIHFNFAPSPLPKLSRRGRNEYTERELEIQGRVDDWLENHMGYAIQMRTRPHTIGFGFNDNIDNGASRRRY